MHIPDGYLSPATCAALYGVAASGWAVALRRLKRRLASRTIPLISVFAAFAFVLMMFNLPLPGGTTGHAVGVAVAAIVLGPSGAILAISLALTIQALFFGDGGITALGANCCNMAIVGALTSWWVYRLLHGAANASIRRKALAAAIAGYVAINLSALCAAVEFGLQPLLFHDAQGAPLYAPYPLSVAIPAMMIGHLTFAGAAEALVSAGIVSYLLRTNPSLLRAEAGGEIVGTAPTGSLRRLWTMVAILLVCTPLGILAAGSAWGEWSASDFANPQTRAAIAQASRHQPPPAAAPKGLEHLATLWTAPFPDYAPAFVKNPWLGYLLSAAFGAGLLLTLCLLAQLFWRRGGGRSSEANGGGDGGSDGNRRTNGHDGERP